MAPRTATVRNTCVRWDIAARIYYTIHDAAQPEPEQFSSGLRVRRILANGRRASIVRRFFHGWRFSGLGTTLAGADRGRRRCEQLAWRTAILRRYDTFRWGRSREKNFLNGIRLIIV